ncbi:MAG: hypothetical protein ACTSQI_07860 [Candidatus Helarchaeota archaeon]
MQDIGYIIGVFCAVGSGILNNLGTVYQKKAVNELPTGEKVGRNLLKNPLWLFGLFLQFVLGTFLFLLAYGMFVSEWGIGAALVPGLMAAGLIVLAIGSLKILGEKLKWQEVLGILFMIIAITMLGFSELETQVTQTNLEDPEFILRIAILTLVLCLIALFCEGYQRKSGRFKGICLAIFSGCMLAISNYWVAPITELFNYIFTGKYILWFLIACIILILTNFFAILKINQSYLHGQAANLIPIQQVPIQITPIVVYFILFLALPAHIYSYPFMIVSVTLIIISFFLLGHRQAQLEKIH